MTNTGPTPFVSGRNLARQHRFWNSRAVSWDHGAGRNPGLVRVVEEVVSQARPLGSEHAVDLGCGSGQVSLAISRKVASVMAIDISEKMISLLLDNAKRGGVTNLDGRAMPVESLEFEPGSVDLVVTNYALHHLRDEDKGKVIGRVYEWLAPGGRLVIGDMMFGRGGDARDRQIIASKLMVFARKGPAGWWRIAKNAGRYLLRAQERPVSMSTWSAMLKKAGFVDVTGTVVVNEAAVVSGTKPRTKPG
ncbi:MAG: class I SAM-dependent methyltransferase [Acidimicrobiales bacterium]